MSSKDSVNRIFIVASVLSIVCAIVVSAASVALRPIQTMNQEGFRKRNILSSANLLDPERTVDEIFEANIRSRLIDLDTGEYSERFPPEDFDQRQALRSPELSVTIPRDEDIANLRRRSKYATVYEVYENDELKTLILPVYGRGLWSTMYGFIAVSADTREVVGLGYYDHAETPGLGGEIDNPRWLAQWEGKQIFDEDWNVRLTVLKGRVDEASPDASYQIDGLTGATLTNNGVRDSKRYWLGPHGFGPYLENIRQRRDLNG